MEHIADAFVTGVTAGMFANNPMVSRSSMRVVSVEGPSEGRMRFGWKARGVPVEAYRVLLNMLAKSHYSSLPLASVRLVSPSKHNRQLNCESLMAGPFPGRTALVPFDVWHAVTLFDSEEPTIRLEFRRAIKDDEMGRFDAVVCRLGLSESSWAAITRASMTKTSTSCRWSRTPFWRGQQP